MSSPPPKRQKLDAAVEVFGSPNPSNPSSVLTIRDLSFQTPLRKKLNLIFTQTAVEAHSPAKQELSIQLKQIHSVICVAAPDKAAKTWNFVVLFKQNESVDAWAFGVSDTAAKTAVGGDTFQLDSTDSYKSVLFTAFNATRSSRRSGTLDGGIFLSNSSGWPTKRYSISRHCTSWC